MPSSFDFSVGPVAAGNPVTVTVDSAPCETVTVTFTVDGQPAGSGTLDPPDSIDFNCPTGTQGKAWKVVVSCPGGDSASKGGIVN